MNVIQKHRPRSSHGSRSFFRAVCSATSGAIGCLLLGLASAHAGNPIVPGVGLTDPQIRVFGDRVWLYATHDYAPNMKTFRMDNWWVWSSDDLVNWRLENIIRPETTYLGKPYQSCWATDAAERNGKYYFYFSGGPQNTGVLVGDSPRGPWRDPIGKPLIGIKDIGVEARDPGIFTEDDSSAYIVVGTYRFFLAKLNEDMVSLAEKPRELTVLNPQGPKGPNRTDDKAFLHKRAGRYYLSWGCYYAMSDQLYGPYQTIGSFMRLEDSEPDFRQRHFTHDRHGSFFSLHGQDYFACNDLSQPGTNSHFRDAVIGYIHYRADGTIAPMRIRGIGVGQYDAAAGVIEAEEFFALKGGEKREIAGGFAVAALRDGSTLAFPKVRNLSSGATITLRAANLQRGVSIEVRRDDAKGQVLGTVRVPRTKSLDEYAEASAKMEGPLPAGKPVDLCLVVRADGKTEAEVLRLDTISFSPAR